jgi:hypothetical protein
MSGNICQECGKEFTTIYSLSRHINKTKKCSSTNQSELVINNSLTKNILIQIGKNIESSFIKVKNIDTLKVLKNQCKWCRRIYANNLILNKHIHELHCNNYKEFLTMKSVLDDIMNKIKIEEQKIPIKEENEIDIVSYGNEDINKLTDDEMGEILYKGHKFNELILKYLYINPRLPENHNILLEVINNKIMIKFYKNNNWEIREFEKYAMKIINNNKKKLREIIDKKEEILIKLKNSTKFKLTELILENTIDVINDTPDTNRILAYTECIKDILYNANKENNTLEENQNIIKNIKTDKIVEDIQEDSDKDEENKNIIINQNTEKIKTNELVPFLLEDINDLTYEEKGKIITSNDLFIKDTIHILHLNKRLKKYRNIKVSSILAEKIKFYKGLTEEDNKIWFPMNIEEGLKEIIQNIVLKVQKLLNKKEEIVSNLKEKGIELCEFDIILTTKQCSKSLIQLYNEVDEYDIKRILCDKN